MMEFVSWDDEIPNIWKNEIHVPNHQPVMVFPLKPQVIENEPLIYQDLATNNDDFFHSTLAQITRDCATKAKAFCEL